ARIVLSEHFNAIFSIVHGISHDQPETAIIKALNQFGKCICIFLSTHVRFIYWRCTCGEEETERHVLFECVLYERLREEWLRRWREERGEEDLVEGVLGFAVTSADLERLVLRSVGKIWKERKRREREKDRGQGPGLTFKRKRKKCGFFRRQRVADVHGKEATRAISGLEEEFSWTGGTEKLTKTEQKVEDSDED
ncbi:hypothetical protein CAPTEDRAFT_210111, partial [Capitella teleta]